MGTGRVVGVDCLDVCTVTIQASEIARVCALLAHPSRPLFFQGTFEPHSAVQSLDIRNGVVHFMRGHTKTVRALALDPTGARLASASSDGSIRVWDFAWAECTLSILGHRSCANAVAWDATGACIASGSDDQCVRFWDPVSGVLWHFRRVHTGQVHALAAHPDADADLLASGSHDKTVRLWRWTTGESIRGLYGHDAPVMTLAASARWLLSGGKDAVVLVWTWDGTCVCSIRLAGPPNLSSLAWRGSRLAIHGGGSLRVIDTRDDDPVKWHRIARWKASIHDQHGVAVMADGSVVSAALKEDVTFVYFRTPHERCCDRRAVACL